MRIGGMGEISQVCVAEWLRRLPAKELSSGGESSNLFANVLFFSSSFFFLVFFFSFHSAKCMNSHKIVVLDHVFLPEAEELYKTYFDFFLL